MSDCVPRGQHDPRRKASDEDSLAWTRRIRKSLPPKSDAPQPKTEPDERTSP